MADSIAPSVGASSAGATVSETGLLRLVAQRLAGPPEPDVLAAARRLVAIQAQDLPGALTSLALRSADRSRDVVIAAFDAGEIVRGWPMRGTLHIVPAEDLGWMVALGAPRPMAAAAKRRAQLGLDDADLRQAHDVARATVPATRDELFAAWDAVGLAPAQGRGYHMLVHLAHSGVLCFGPTRDGEPVIVAVEEWIRRPRQLDRDEALGEWIRRYVAGHGPATLADVARWTGLTMGDARTGLAVARPALASIEIDGVEHLMDPETPDRLASCVDDAVALRLLPGFDEFVLGYGDRSAVLDPAFADRIVPGGNGMFRSTVVVGGRVVGTWRAPRGRFVAEPFEGPKDDATVPWSEAEAAYAGMP